jgi:integrase
VSVFRRKGNPYYRFDFVFRGRRHQGSTSLTNKEAAKRFEHNLREKLAKQRGGIVDVEPPPFFLLFAASFLGSEKHLRPNTLRNYHVALGNLMQFHKRRLDEITASGIEDFKTKRLAERRSPSTVNRDLSFLRRVLQVAVSRDLLSTSPFIQRKVKLLRERQREHIVSFSEERKYLAVATQPLKDIAVLLVEMGLRPEEACSIRRRDLHFHTAPPFLHVPDGKTPNAKRDVPLTSKTKEVLSARSANAKGECLFPRRVGSGYDWTEPMNELHKAHYEALADCGLRFRPYDLRHTYATRAIEGGMNPLTLMKLMGHASLQTTLRYVHLSKRHLAEAQQKIEQHRRAAEIAEAEAERGEATLQ